MYTPLLELVEAFTKLKLQEGFSQQEAESIANTVFKLYNKRTFIEEEIPKINRLRKRMYKILNKQDEYQEFYFALFSKDGHEKPFRILKFFATMDVKGRVYWEHQTCTESHTEQSERDHKEESEEEETELPEYLNCFHVNNDKIIVFLQ